MSRSGSDPKSVFLDLLAYCNSNNWAGYDPYDALNSKLFEGSPFARSKVARLVMTQGLKRLPVNVRGAIQIQKSQNAKAIALFLVAMMNAENLCRSEVRPVVDALAQRLIDLRSAENPYWCWGYNFPWQTRTILVPRGAPNLVCTTFVAEACLSYYERYHAPEFLEMAASACEYLLNELYWSTDGTVAGFCYPQPSVHNQVHNANLMAAALLCRLHKHTGNQRLLGPALKVARHSARKQQADGSWLYGEAASQQWIDNFHTGYNLGALRSISRDLATGEFNSNMSKGLKFYRENFFAENGRVKYYHDRRYPVDIHCVAQGIITLLEYRDVEPENTKLAHSVFEWAMKYMWDERGFFYYQVRQFGTVRISYMRWSQAWMLRALSELIRASDRVDKTVQTGLLQSF